MSEQELFHVVPVERHNELIARAYEARGYSSGEASDGARLCAAASRHGIRTHNGLKALHLDELFGSGKGGCVPGAEIEVVESRFKATEVWNANKKLGQSTAYAAMERCVELADEFGVGIVSVDNAFHYLWGGGYVMDAARRGYVAYTNCTAALAEVVPFMGKFPTMGTNPHSFGFPTVEALGFPIVADWATSTVAMGRVQVLLREGKKLPPNSAVDSDGNPTDDPNKVAALLPFGAHKGYALALINELYGALIGGSLPTLRSRPASANEKTTPCFYFQVIHPDALSGNNFAKGRSQSENMKAVLDDVFGHGNESCILPGQLEAEAAKRSDEAGGLLFSPAEIKEFNELAESIGQPSWETADLKTVS